MQCTDLPAVYQIEQVSHSHPWSEGILRDCLRSNYHCFVAERLSAVCGYLIAMPAVEELHLLNICVRPDAQQSGCGKQLLKALCFQAQASGVSLILLEVRASNAAAQRLYQSFGFEYIGTRRNYYPATTGREDALVMKLTLPPEVNVTQCR